MAGEFRLTLPGCQSVGACSSDCAAARDLVWTGDVFEGADLLAHSFLPRADQYVGGFTRGAAGPARADALAAGNAGANLALPGTPRQPAGFLGRLEGGRYALGDRRHRRGAGWLRPRLGISD